MGYEISSAPCPRLEMGHVVGPVEQFEIAVCAIDGTVCFFGDLLENWKDCEKLNKEVVMEKDPCNKIPNGGTLNEQQAAKFIDTVVEGIRDGTIKPDDIDKAAFELTDVDFTGRYADFKLASRLPDLPQRKYYGTPVYVFWKREGSEMVDSHEFSLWFPTGTPSDRWLAEYGITRKQWDDNAKVYNEANDEWYDAREILCDCHYESDLTLALAQMIVDAINGKKKE